MEFIDKSLKRGTDEEKQESINSNNEENQDSEGDISFYEDVEEEETDRELTEKTTENL